MALHFLDANIIIRHVTKDNPTLSKKAHYILRAIEAGTLTVTSCEAVIAECVHVLASKSLYRFSRTEVRTVLDLILSFKGLKLPHKNTYRHALKLYESSSIDFADALTIAHMKRLKITDIYSFDRDFDKVEGVKRRSA